VLGEGRLGHTLPREPLRLFPLRFGFSFATRLFLGFALRGVAPGLLLGFTLSLLFRLATRLLVGFVSGALLGLVARLLVGFASGLGISLTQSLFLGVAACLLFPLA
jgi:hypothetical protein